MDTKVQTNQNAKFEAFIKYCAGWGYGSKFNQVKQLILSHYPNATVNGERDYDNPGAFEVFINGQLIHSKLKSKSFIQDPNKLIMDIKNIVEA